MGKTILEFEEKHHILVVDGVEYEIPQRTAALEKQIIEHDRRLNEMSEYESNMNLLVILFGEKAVAQMFSDMEATNLDKLAKCTKYALQLFMAEYNAMQTEELDQKMQKLNPLLSCVEQVGRLSEALPQKQAVKNKPRKTTGKKK